MPIMAYPAQVELPSPKPVVWMGDTLTVMREFPKAVREKMGYALYQAQVGGKHADAKPLRGFGAGVLEVVSDHRGNTYRAVYTVRLASRVYVLHAFQKKSKRGISSPGSELDLVRQRLKRAAQLHAGLES